MSMGRRVGSYVLIALACAFLFLIPSTYVVGRGGPAWLAAIVGGLAFPILPGAWHAVAERRRRKAAAAAKLALKPSASLTGADRLVLRLVAVAVVALAPLIAFDRGGVWTGLRHHAGWFIPSGDGGGSALAGDLLRRVPPDAEAVMVFSDRPATLLSTGAVSSRPAGGVIALGAGKAMLITPTGPHPGQLTARLSQWLDKISAQPIGPLVEANDGTTFITVSAAWRGKTGGPGPALTRELGRAPAQALIAFAMAPTTSRDAETLRAGAGWIVPTATGVRIEARFEALDDHQAETFLAALRAALPLAPPFAPVGCRDSVTTIVAGFQLDRAGAVVTVHAEVGRDVLAGLAGCAVADPP